MWTKRTADPQLIETIKELVFMNQHTNLTTDRMFRLLPETDCYFVLDALAEARDLGYIYCVSGRWAIRVQHDRVHYERGPVKVSEPAITTSPVAIKRSNRTR